MAQLPTWHPQALTGPVARRYGAFLLHPTQGETPMNPNSILLILLTIVVIRIFTTAADATTKAEALRKAGYTRSASNGCLDLVLVVAMTALWWWYAIDTSQHLLGWIPTAGLVAAVISAAVEGVAKAKRGTK